MNEEGRSAASAESEDARLGVETAGGRGRGRAYGVGGCQHGAVRPGLSSDGIKDKCSSCCYLLKVVFPLF